MNEPRDPTTDPTASTWVPVGDTDFPIQNLPYGAIVRPGETVSHLAVAIGNFALDLWVLAEAGIFDDVVPDARALLGTPSLDALLGRDRETWRAVRAAIFAYLHAGAGATSRDAELASRALVDRGAVRNVLPFRITTYVDFFASLEHATALGAIVRPGTEPLAPNWRWLPAGYHGRASTVGCDASVVRPHGQRAGPGGVPVYAPTRELDYELELGYVTGGATDAPLRADDARARAFGVVLLCDWSARDVQAWESRPLGPFLGKSFATTLAPWIVTLDALAPYRCAAPEQQPPPLPHLREIGDGAFDVALEVGLRTAAMRARGDAPDIVARTNARGLYWTIGQQLAHVASNGTRLCAGDLYGTGTISGEGPDACGSLIERTWRGTRPVMLCDGSTRTFLETGDEVVMRGGAERARAARVGFGTLRAVVVD
ncbi:MAG: fumarylacetoacetase [Vulcanimicrobiaceae bacterium]